MTGAISRPSRTSVVAKGLSGEAFTFKNKPDPDMTPRNKWHKLHLDNLYRKEWDKFASELKVDPKNSKNFPLINSAMDRYVHAVLQAQSRGIEPSKSARMAAVRDALKQQAETTRPTAPAAIARFAPQTTAKLQALTSPNGGLTQTGRAGVNALSNDSSLRQTAWGASFQVSIQNIKTQAAFAKGFTQGAFNGGKDMAVGLANVAEKNRTIFNRQYAWSDCGPDP